VLYDYPEPGDVVYASSTRGPVAIRVTGNKVTRESVLGANFHTHTVWRLYGELMLDDYLIKEPMEWNPNSLYLTEEQAKNSKIAYSI
jgi:hypothetical protein